jgi:hypothetical protein
MHAEPDQKPDNHLSRTSAAGAARPNSSAQEYLLAKQDRARRLKKAETLAQSAFPALDSIEPHRATIPLVDELFQYRSTLSQRLLLAAADRGLRPDRADKLLNLLTPAQLHDGFQALMQHLRDETNYLKELEDTLIAQALPHPVEEGSFGAKVKFVPPRSGVSKLLNRKRAQGAYHPSLDVAMVFSQAPTQREIWHALATTGVLPAAITILDHELTHDTQVNKSQRALMWLFRGSNFAVEMAAFGQFGFLGGLGVNSLIKPGKNKVAESVFGNTGLLETHAFEAASASPTANVRQCDERDEIITAVTNYPGARMSPDEARLAYDLIRSLRLLGLNDRELGPLVSADRFDKKKKTFPRMAAALEDERAKRNLQDQGVFAFVREALEARHQVELLAESAGARRLASKGLVKVVAKAARPEP